MGYRDTYSKTEPDSERLSHGLQATDKSIKANSSKSIIQKKNSGTKSKFKFPKKIRHIYKLSSWMGAVIFAFIILFAAAVLIAEPWVKPLVSQKTSTGYERLSDVQIAVGDTLDFSTGLKSDESAEIVYISIPDALEDSNGGKATAIGEYYSVTVRVHIKKSGEAAKYAHVVKFFNLDLSEKYNSLRTFLRSLINIKEDELPDAERVTEMYEQVIKIKGLDAVTVTQPKTTLEVEESETLELVLNDGQNYEVASSDSSIIAIEGVGESTNEFVVDPIAQGQANIYVVVGSWVQASEEEYAAYIEAADDLPALDGLDAQQTAAAHLNQVYIRTGRIIYPIAVNE